MSIKLWEYEDRYEKNTVLGVFDIIRYVYFSALRGKDRRRKKHGWLP